MKMKRTYILLTLLLLFFSDFAFSALSIEGTYQGKNLYVQNPIDDEGFGYCATKVTVNGDIMPGGTGSGAFEIDFGIFNIALGEPVFIVIEHHDGCKPKILNPEVLLPRSTFNVVSINVSEDKLKWETTNENGNQHTATITEPLMAKMSCITVNKPILARGIITFVKNNVTSTLDYGEGECDNIAIYSINGNSYTINIGN